MAASISVACPTTLITGDTFISANDTQYDGTELVVRSATVTLAGQHSFCRLVLEQGAVLTHAGVDTVGIDLQVSGSLRIDATSRIDTDRKGWPARTGPGAPSVGTNGGGGHGGRGGNASNGLVGGASFGSWALPAEPGSGGGGATGGPGGGRIRLAVFDTLAVDGVISANGGDSGLASHGGGAGGSIQLAAGTFLGSGTVTAIGGAGGTGGGGGGGRIAVAFAATTFSGAITATGGAGGTRGGAGTIFTAPSSTRGQLRVANAGLPAGARTDLHETMVAADVVVTAGAVVEFFETAAIQGDLRIDSDAFVSRDGSGYVSGEGPGAGVSGGGGGYGGAGGASGSGQGAGGTYGSLIYPFDRGSGGAGPTGGHGGGRIVLNVQGTLTVDGALSADGAPPGLGSHGGGSGGTIRLYVGGLAGNGTISARGGTASNAGGGGGGRVVIYAPACYTGFDVATQVDVAGGAGINGGQPGTTFFGYGHVAAAGMEDDFALPSEPAAPGADLLAALAPELPVGFDEDPAGGNLAHTFDAVSPATVAAKLAIRLRATSASAGQDELVLGFADGAGFHVQWSRYLGNTNGTGDPGLLPQPWTNGAEATLVLDLAQLALVGGGSLDLTGALAQHEQLDLVVRHFTAVDFALLTYCTNDLSPVEDEGPAAAPMAALRLQTTPNPFNPRVTLGFELPAATDVRLAIYDVRGRRVAEPVNGRLAAGHHDVVFDGARLGAGVYLVRMVAGADIATTRMTLLK